MVWSMISVADLPISFWGYVLETAAYLLNRVPTKSVVSTPYVIWKGKKHDLKVVKIGVALPTLKDTTPIS